MSGNELAQNFVSLKGLELRMIHTLLFRINIGSLVSSKTKDIFSFNKKEHLMDYISKEVELLENKSDSELQVNIMLELEKISEVRSKKYNHRQEIIDQFHKMTDKIYDDLIKYDKDFKKFSVSIHSENKLKKIIHYEMIKLSNLLGEKLESNSQSKTNIDELSTQIEIFIETLPAEKQAQIKKSLGLDQISNKTIYHVITSGGASLLFSTLVQVSGFAFFTSATSLLATVASIVGVTLPFSIYTGATSTIAVIANPIFFLPVLIGGSSYFINRQNKVLNKKILAVIIMQIALSDHKNRTNDEIISNFNLFIKEWEVRFDDYCKQSNTLDQLQEEHRVLQAHIRIIKKKINSINKNLRVKEKRISRSNQKLSKLPINNTDSNEHIYNNKNSNILEEIKSLNNDFDKLVIEVEKLSLLENQIKKDISKVTNSINLLLKNNPGFNNFSSRSTIN